MNLDLTIEQRLGYLDWMREATGKNDMLDQLPGRRMQAPRG